MRQFQKISYSIHEEQSDKITYQDQKVPLKTQHSFKEQKKPAPQANIQRVSSDFDKIDQRRVMTKQDVIRIPTFVKQRNTMLSQKIFSEVQQIEGNDLLNIVPLTKLNEDDLQNKIFDKIQLLPIVEKIYLLRHLQSPQNDTNVGQIESNIYGRRQSSEMAHNKISGEVKQHKHKLTIHILSTHGSRAECGLSEIDIYDSTGERITLIHSIKVLNSPLDNLHQILRLCDGYTYTIDDQHMWSCNLPINSDDHIKLQLTFETPQKVGGIRIWNYNKSLLDAKIGVRQVEIELDGLLIYKGSIKQGNGIINQDYSHYIPIRYEGETKVDLVERPAKDQPIRIAQSGLIKQYHVGKGSFDQENVKENYVKNQKQNIQQRISYNEQQIKDQPYMQYPFINQYKRPQQKKQIPIKSHPKVLNVFEINDQRQLSVFHKDSTKSKASQSSQRGLSAGSYGQMSSPQSKIDQVRILSEQSFVQSGSSKQGSTQKKVNNYFSLQEHVQNFPYSANDLTDQGQNPNKVIEAAKKKTINSLIPQPFMHGKRTEKVAIKNVASIASRLENKFKIPTLPQGRFLKLTILKNHGDKKCVGLGGIEVFDDSGDNLTQNMRLIKVQGQDQLLPLEQFLGLTTDQQSGVLIPNQKFSLDYDLGGRRKISMIRIWNYNKSRIYCDNGVSRMQGRLDDLNLFLLDIRKATSNKAQFENCEVILFTNNQIILDQIAAKDQQPQQQGDNELRDSELFIQSVQNFFGERPNTGDFKKQKDDLTQQQSSNIRFDNKPTKKENFYPKAPDVQSKLLLTNQIFIEFLAPMNRLVGLTGIEVLDDDMQPLQNLTIEPLQSIKNKSAYNYDVLVKQFLTIDENKMLVLPCTQGQGLKITTQQKVDIRAIRVYNFNALVQQSSAQGVRLVKIKWAGMELIKYLRPGPQIAGYIDYGQTISMINQPYMLLPTPPTFFTNQIYEHNLPALQGQLIRFELIQTHGDPHYIGLDGFEIYDHNGQGIISKKISEFKIIGVPNISGDQRQVANLLNLPHDSKNSFLAPFVNTPYEPFRQTNQEQLINKIIVLLDVPTTITSIDFWNYTKDPDRGVKDIHIYVDSNLVYQAQLNQAKLTSICFSKRLVINAIENDIQSSVRYSDEGRVKLLTHKNQSTDADNQPQKILKTLHELIERPPTRGGP